MTSNSVVSLSHLRLQPVIPLGALQGGQPRRFGLVKNAKWEDSCIRNRVQPANPG